MYEGPGSGRPLVLILGRQVEFRDLSNQEFWGEGGSTCHTWASPGVQRPILCSAVPHAGTSAWLCRGLGRGWPPILCAPALSHRWTSDARSAGSCERTVSATLAPRQKGRLVSPLRGPIFHSTNIHRRLGIRCSGRSHGGPRTPLKFGGRRTTQMAPVNWELCILMSVFKPKPGCTYLSENELHQCHPHIQPKVTLNIPSK